MNKLFANLNMRNKIVLIVAGLYMISPIDLFPGVPVDDVIVAVLASADTFSSAIKLKMND